MTMQLELDELPLAWLFGYSELWPYTLAVFKFSAAAEFCAFAPPLGGPLPVPELYAAPAMGLDWIFITFIPQWLLLEVL